MKMNVFEYTVTERDEDVAAFENLDDAIAFARHIANERHNHVHVINAFTGEVHYYAEVYAYICYNSRKECIDTIYKVKENGES